MTKISRTIRWSLKNILTEALLFPTVALWVRTSPRSVRAAKKLGKFAFCQTVLNSRHFEVVQAGMSLEHGVALSTHLEQHPSPGRKPGKTSGKHTRGQRRAWTLELVLQTVLKYESFAAWKKKERAAFFAAKRRGFLPIVSKLLGGNREDRHVSLKDLNDEALLAEVNDTGARTWRALQAENRSLYAELRRRVLETGLVTKLGLPRGPSWSRRWTEDMVFAAAKRATSMLMLDRMAPGASKAARRLGIDDDIRRLYFTLTKAGARLTADDCINSAELHSTFDQWLAADRQAAIRASRMGWLEETTYHFTDDGLGRKK